jgi:hypothetical protein
MPAIKPYPMQMVRDARARPLRHPLRPIPRPRHADPEPNVRQPLQDLPVVVLSRQAPGSISCSATETWTKSRACKRAEAGGGTQRMRCTLRYAP